MTTVQGSAPRGYLLAVRVGGGGGGGLGFRVQGSGLVGNKGVCYIRVM